MTEPTTAVRDFTKPRQPIEFTIDGDIFKAPSIVSPIMLAKIAKDFAQFEGGIKIDTSKPDSIGDTLRTVAEMCKALMPGASGERFAARLLADGSDPETQPIDLMSEVIPALFYLLECYGLRPTAPSSDLESALTTGASEDGAQPEASIGEDSTASPLS